MTAADHVPEPATRAPVLICYDGSESARAAIQVAADLLGSRAAVVLDVGPMLTASESIAMASSVVPGNAFVELNEYQAQTVAREGARLASAAGFDARPHTKLAACTWDGILAVADELDAPLIVMGTRALSPGRELLAGSVSHEVVVHAHRPVLVVPPPRA